MTEAVRKYCARAVVRLLDGNFVEFDRLVSLAIEDYKQEKEKEHLYYRIGEVVPNTTIQQLYKKTIA